MGVNKKLLVLVSVPVVIGTSIIIVNSRPDNAITEIATWGVQTPYQVIRERKIDVPNDGVLGSFYSCLAEYRHISTRKITGKLIKQGQRLTIKVNNNAVLYLAVNDNEAYRVSLELMEKGGDIKYESYSYAINCDLGLLNN